MLFPGAGTLRVFEDAEQKERFEEGKWSLIMLVVPNNSSNIHIYFICMHVSII